eukprot:TRINITY_DN30328_c0_g1_i1.p1 TRINITY_DN30328_c0_g1~~TRINITY_DN30328_c0_g1_i1.p1  ORF type:complete len:2757 (-),score=438.74 TRINITY_DN30328_c0_g1_i1:344-7405(-)
MAENDGFEVVNKTLQLILCLLDDPSVVSEISVKWDPVFDLRNSSLLTFIEGLLEKDPSISYAFRFHIIRAMNDLIEDLPEEVVNLMLMFFERTQGQLLSSDAFDGALEDKCSRICNFFKERICWWTRLMNDIATGSSQSSTELDESELGVLWGIICCYHHFLGLAANPSVMMNFINALDLFLTIEADKIAGVEKLTWQSLLGAALTSYDKMLLHSKSGLSETSNFMRLAKRFKSSSQVLSAVADFLDSLSGDKLTCQAVESPKFFHPELNFENAVDAIKLFADNLSLSDNKIRTATLRLLCHYEPLDHQLSTSDHHPEKKLKLEESQKCYEDTECSNVVELLLSLESTPLSISTSRKVIIFISRIQMGLSAGKFSEAYIPLVFNGIIGILNKRFGHLWEPAIECLGVLLSKYVTLVWDGFVKYIENIQSTILTSHGQGGILDAETQGKTIGLIDRFRIFRSPDSDSTPSTTVFSMLLQSIQRVPSILESRSRQLIPLLLKFLGYTSDETLSVGSFNRHACKGKEWKGVLKEWLNLLKLMRNPRSLYQSQAVKEVLANRLLEDTDPDVQLKALDCLLNWRDEFLIPYSQHLKTLIASKSLREELTTWTLSKDSNQIQEEHRGYLVPVVIRLLMPKVIKLKTLASRKHTGVQHRRAVLSFLAQLDVNELPLFFSLLLKSLQPITHESECYNNQFWSSLECIKDESHASIYLGGNIANIPWKTRYGFLHVIEDIMKSFDEFHIRPFLNVLMTSVVRILESCTISLESAKCDEPSIVGKESTQDSAREPIDAAENTILTSTAVNQFKDLRSLCLKTISSVLNKYECHDFGSEFWDIFFRSVKPLIDSFRQEGSSSEKPSSLFSCFVTMSRSPTLVSLLDREESLVPTIFSILTVKTTSDAIITYALTFVENLLNLDHDFEHHEDCAIKRVLLPHIETLILCLHDLCLRRKLALRISGMTPGKTEFRILKLLAKYIKDPMAAMKFVDIMLPFLAKRALSSDECLEGLRVIQVILSVVGGDNAGKILNVVHPLLLSSGLEIRLAVCDVIDGLAVNDPSLAILAKLVHDLNAMSLSEMGEIDYDTRINAYEAITPELFFSGKEEHALVILSHCIYDMSSDELIFRQSATKSLLSFVKFAASFLECEAIGGQEKLLHDNTCSDAIPTAVGTLRDDGSWTKTRIQRIINKFFLFHMGQAMSKEISIQREWMSLLRDMVLNLPGIPALKSCSPLCSKDVEVDFFNNILHLQKHRRARALSRFRNVISSDAFPEKITMKVFVPLFFSMLFDTKDAKDEHVRNACLESLAYISGYMQWESYHAFLLRCFREMTSKPDKQKVLLRLICFVLDKFHFSEIYCNEDPKDRGQEVSNGGTMDGNSHTILANNCFTSGINPEIQASLEKTILPKVQKLLDSNNERVNVTVSLAALKLLKLLPLDMMESQLPTVIHRISNFLKNRLESIRDEARSALAACSKELGLEYLHFITNVLRATLKRGYELHVLGYTLHFVLSKTLSDASVGKLDYCLEEIIAIAENDILGGVAEEKEVEKIASKMKETRKNKSFDTLKLIAQNITFKTHALKLLSPIKDHLQKHLTPKVQAKLEAILHHIAAGISCNQTVDQTDLFVFVYGIIEDGIAEENLQGRNSSITKNSELCSHEMSKEGNHSRKVVSRGSQSSHLITVFALGLLHNHFKNMKFDKKDERLLPMLDPFVGLLSDCLTSKYENIVSAALKCLTPLIRLPLHSIEVQADRMKILLLDFIQKSGSGSSPMMQSCLKLLTALLRSTRISLSNDQLHMLIQFPLFIDLESNPSFVALSLLKAIVGRKLVVHEIYDLVSRVAELMVTSQLEPIRKKCSQILLQFLLDYHLSAKRLQQHLDFLLANLSYEHPSGREAVLEMLHAILIKFPKSVVDSQAQTFFLHLVVCLANDNESKVRSMVAAAIKLLIGRTSQQALHPILEYCLSWYKGGNPHLWSAAAQVLGLLVEVLKKGFQSHIQGILQAAYRIMMSALDIDTNRELDCSDEAKIPFWKEAYHSIVMLEKMLLQYPELFFDKDNEDTWEAVSRFLLHPHMWLRNTSSRLVASYFTYATEAKNLNQTGLDLESFLLMKPSRLFRMAVSLCCQLQLQVTDASVANLITENLVVIICSLHSFAIQRKCTDLFEFLSTLALSERDHFGKSFELLGSRKFQNMFQALTSSDSGGGVVLTDQNIQSIKDLQSLLVAPLLKRMGKLALQKEDTQIRVVFNSFRFISSQIGLEGCNDYAINMLLPLYKICEGFSGKVITEEVKQLAEEVLDSIRGILGHENYVRVYNLIRKDLKAKRDKRKREEKLIAVINPVRHAKRKMRIATKHREHKRRKIMTMKMRRW